jgi:predicted secreted acid phosphatase
MKIKNYRLFISGFATAAFVLLSGFKSPDVHDALLTGTQAASVNVKQAQFNSKGTPVGSQHKKTKNKHSKAKDAERQKALDLSISFKDAENAWLKVEQGRMAKAESANMFAIEHKKKPRTVDLDGQMIMSQEPEADKRKSLDGAAIVINLKR